MSVILSTGVCISSLMSFLGGFSGPRFLLGVGVGGYVRGWSKPLGHPPLRHGPEGGLLTPSGSHHTYGGQAGSTHPTGMLSCF